mmetsp:Transcript_109700/g.354172  ORF Transcript_109700/g.354172 Transcript_109700/m.354172 type:complete len:669 (-) Transcript_109700:109-2115(-)
MRTRCCHILLQALALLPAARPAAGACDASQYQAAALALACQGGSGSRSFSVQGGQKALVASFPAGASDVRIQLDAKVDLDMQVEDAETGSCIVGYACQHSASCGADESVACISYEGMSIFFSGDDTASPVSETVRFAGPLTRGMSVSARAVSAGVVTATYSYAALPTCPDPLPGCAPCGSYAGCGAGETPQCTGSETVTCLAPKVEQAVVEDSGSDAPWIVLAVVLLLGGAVIGGILWYLRGYRREVRRLREEAKKSPPTRVPSLGNVRDGGLQSRVGLEAPPSDWPADGEPRLGWVPPGTSSNEPAEIVATHPLRVNILGAVGHVLRPVFCVCEVIGKPQSRFQTQVVRESQDPRWDTEKDVPDFCAGDTLRFSVYDQDWGKPDELLGMAELDTNFYPEGFEGELPLSQAGVPFRTTGFGEGTGTSISEGRLPAIRLQVTTAVWASDSTPFFVARWTALSPQTRNLVFREGAMRSDWTGDVGFRFMARSSLLVTALGRPAHTGSLRQAAGVTLWSAETQAPLASVSVGPNSTMEGGYAFGLLKQEVLLEAGKEYRLSQQCTDGMADAWFDGIVDPNQLQQWSASQHVEFGGSVYSAGLGYPDKLDSDLRFPQGHRRAGMLNFKMLGKDPVAEAERFQGDAETAEEECGNQMQIRLVCMSPTPAPEAV